jgi:hypothetical protein
VARKIVLRIWGPAIITNASGSSFASVMLIPGLVPAGFSVNSRMRADAMSARHLIGVECPAGLRLGPVSAGTVWPQGKAHQPSHLGYAGRWVLVSRKWSVKTLADHRGELLQLAGQRDGTAPYQ